MLEILARALRLGVLSEPDLPLEADVDRIGKQLRQAIDRRFRGSLSIRQVDAGSCNGCELEIHALGNPYYDIERFGVHFVASPRHADVLLVTGPVSRHMEYALRRAWEVAPAPRWVIASGDCAIDGGEFAGSHACCGGVGQVLPVDLRIPGCPPSPRMLLAGILALLQGAEVPHGH